MDATDLTRMLSDPAIQLRAAYFAASAFILVVQAVPALRCRFLAYGPRATPASPQAAAPLKRSSPVLRFLDSLASITVPHHYFTHFYVVSVLSSLFWGWRLRGVVCPPTLSNSHSPDHAWIHSMTARQVQLAWLLMLLQGARRLIETYSYTLSSKSAMWFGHWIMGLLFYAAVNVAVWIEGTPVLEGRVPMTWIGADSDPLKQQQFFQWKLAILVPAILTAHVLQNSYHAYLYHLRTGHSTYQLPSHPFFPGLLCPHYTCEVIIYLLLSVLAAPVGATVNWTLLSVAFFVATNLAVTSCGTKGWYVERFGPDMVKGRRRMIPWVW